MISKKRIAFKKGALSKAKKSSSPYLFKSPTQSNYGLNDLFTPVNIYDYRIRKMIFVNDKFMQLTGLTIEQCYSLDLDQFDSWIDPSDLAILKAEVATCLGDTCRKVVNKKTHQLKYSVNFRLKDKKGIWRHVLSQCSVVEWDDNRFPAVVINLLTDITYHKKNHKISLIINHFDEAEDQWKTLCTKEFLHSADMLSAREREIMTYMLEDKTAHEISDIMESKFNTVRTHWNNILKKTSSKSQKELKEKARSEGWM